MNNEKLEVLYQSLNGAEKSYFEFFEEKIAQLKPLKVLGVGSGWGLSAIAFLRKSEAHLTTIDKQQLETLNLFKERIDLFNLWDRLRFVSGDSKEMLPKLEDDTFDIAYIDGDHGYRGAKSDFDLIWPKVKRGGYLFCDDVFHYLNWETRDTEATKGEPEFGVTRAIGEWIMHHGKKLIVYPIANGIAEIKL